MTAFILVKLILLLYFALAGWEEIRQRRSQ